MPGGISYSPRSMAGKNPIWTTAALKHTPLVPPWCPNSAHVPLFWKAIQTFIKNTGWESINLGWDNVVSGPRIPAFYSVACSATSCLPAPQVPLCQGWIGVVCPALLCLASCLHRGSWYLASLFNQNGKQHLMSNETRGIPRWPGEAADLQWRQGAVQADTGKGADSCCCLVLFLCWMLSTQERDYRCPSCFHLDLILLRYFFPHNDTAKHHPAKCIFMKEFLQ